MHGLVIDVRALTLCDIETIILRLGGVPEMFLLIADVVLSACHNASCLDTLDGRRNKSAGKVWVWREAFLGRMLISPFSSRQT